MLINYDSSSPVYVIGTGIPAQEISSWIKQEYSDADVKNISHEEYEKLPEGCQCVIGFANPEYRKNLIYGSTCQKQRWLTFIHPTSLVENVDNIGVGSVVEPKSTVMYAVSIGNFAWITPHVMIGHGSKIGVNFIVNPGTIIGGSTIIGDNVLVGQFSSVKDRVTVGNDIEFTMNSVVTKDITEAGKYYGNKKILFS